MEELLIQIVVGLGFLLLSFLITRQTRYFWRTRNVQHVSLADVAKACTDSQTLILDVRTRDEYLEGHIPGAVSLPLFELPDRMNEIPKDSPVFIICHSSERSLQAVKFLMGQGYQQVFNVLQGMDKWQGAVTRNSAEK